MNADPPIPTTSSQPERQAGIAVLPFVNMSSDAENEYFSDGITEEIINALTKIKGLKVISRTSSFAFKNHNIDIRKIGGQLGVATILEGSIRKARNKVRITAQLINTGDGSHLWSRNFDRQLEDIFELQDEISLLIADQIRENFGHFELQDHLIAPPTHNIEAYNLYLKGRYHYLKWSAEGMIKAVEYYRQSIKLDPSFALPYFGAGLACGVNAAWRFIPHDEGIQQAEAFLKQGLKINDKDYIGIFAQAIVSFWGKWDFKEGYRFFAKSLQLNPAFTDAEEGLAEIYTAIGDFDKALEHTRNILRLNPLSPNHYYTKANIYYLTKDYAKAIDIMRGALKIDPGFSLAIEMIAACYILLKDYQKLDQLLTNYPQAQRPNECRALFQLMYPGEEVPVDLTNIRTKVRTKSDSSLIAWHLYLQVYLGHHDIALDILEEGVKCYTGQLINFRNDPFLTPLYQMERFQALVRSVFHPSQLPSDESDKLIAPDEKEPGQAPMNDREIQASLSVINNLLEKEAIYLDPNLSLKLLAEKVGIHPNKLSWLLNNHIGKNFNEHINSYRLEAFKQKALDPDHQHLTLLGLAYESGFNSKTVFNSFFKKTEGLTPRKWLNAAKNQ